LKKVGVHDPTSSYDGAAPAASVGAFRNEIKQLALKEDLPIIIICRNYIDVSSLICDTGRQIRKTISKLFGINYLILTMSM